MTGAGVTLGSFFIPSPEHKPQWYTIKTKCLPKTVNNETFIGKMDIFWLIGKNYK
jgi:hypothetical protein